MVWGAVQCSQHSFTHVAGDSRNEIKTGQAEVIHNNTYNYNDAIE